MSISHIPGDRQELLEKKEQAERHVERLALPNEIKTEREGDEQLQKRRQEREKAREEAKKAGSAIAEFDPTDSVNAAALAETIGDQARYTIDQKLNLARQRSALLP